MIEGINIIGNAQMDFYNKFDDKINMLPNLKKVNIFIGENNCGKSRLMRSFLKENFNIYSSENANRNIGEYNKNCKALRDTIRNLKNSAINDLSVILKGILLEENDVELFYIINEIFPQIEKIKMKLDIYNSDEAKIISSIEYLKRVINNIKTYTIEPGSQPINRKNITYIPILRGKDILKNQHLLVL